MKQIKILLAGFAAMAISFVSCTNDFESAMPIPMNLMKLILNICLIRVLIIH